MRSTYPAHEHEKFAAHFRGLMALWVKDQGNLSDGPSDVPEREVTPHAHADRDVSTP